MNKYYVGVWHETGGYMTIKANTKKQAEKKALEKLNNDGEKVIENVTHRDFEIICDTKLIK